MNCVIVSSEVHGTPHKTRKKKTIIGKYRYIIWMNASGLSSFGDSCSLDLIFEFLN